MGLENKNEFTGGTLYIGDCAIEVKSLEMTDFESMVDATDDFHSVAKIVKEPMEFTGTIDIKFSGLAKLLGFWPAVKWKIGRLMIWIKKYLHIVSPSGRYQINLTRRNNK